MDVSSALEAHQNKFKSIEVEKLVPVEFDLNLLAAFDTNAIDEKKLSSKKENYLKELNRDNAQLLFNQIFKLPVESTDAGLLAKLPESSHILPREKALPKAKPMTRWEKFAQIKGIQKKKKERMVIDEATGEYSPRWGYGGGKKDKTKDWLLEVPSNVDPMEDQYAKLREEKKERVDKNKKRQKRNEEEASATSKGQDPRQVKKKQLQDAIAVTKRSTASLGRFDKHIEGEPKMKGMKRQFAPNITDSKVEKQASMDILNKVVGKNGEVLNVQKAVRQSKRARK
ncbi:hypothetical protein INT43_001117 [Umbelopsis isabellina]|uniref:Ribosome biogenesis regulatory protein n=1 Tax=Mortierella isabellina TaxID=91625 RepID=A0A8H7PKP0_MORIS|nr:hypothetical protein INT43_001117 [Umbelopsis isabellina]